MTLAFEFNHKKVLFLVSLISVFSVASVSAQTDICNIKTDFLNLTDKNVSLESYQIIEVDFDHTFNTIYFTPKKEIKQIDINFRNEREFRIFDFKVAHGDKTIFFDPNARIVQDDQGFSFHHELKFDGMETLKVTYWMTNVIQEKSEKWYFFEFGSEFWYPFDKYSLFLNNVSMKQGVSVGKKYCFQELDIKKLMASSVTAKYQCGDVIEFKSVGRPRNHTIGNIGIIGPITHTLDGQIEDIEIKSGDIKCKTNSSAHFNVDVSFERGQRTKFIFGILVAYLTLVTLYVLKKSHNRNFWERFFEVYVKYSILPWLFSEITTTITPPSRPLTVTLFDLTIFIPILILGIVHIYWRVLDKRELLLTLKKYLKQRKD